jgi:hypothetical protein
MEYFRVTVDVLAWDDRSAIRIARRIMADGPTRFTKVEPIRYPNEVKQKVSDEATDTRGNDAKTS